MTGRKAALAAWAAIAVACLIYGPMAIEYMWRFFTPQAPQLWNHTFSGVVGHRMAEGAGSIHAEQQNVYTASRWLLLTHTTGGGLAILLAAAQFSQQLRIRRPTLHRHLGRIQVGIVIVSTLTAMGYLLRTGPHATFAGPAFYAQLWALAFGTLASALLAVAAVVRGQIQMHQTLMAYMFALLLTAPLLRVEYLVLGLAWPDQTQLVTNLAGAATLQALAIGGAIVASRRLDSRPRPSHPPASIPAAVPRTIWGASVITAIAVAIEFHRLVGGFDRVIATYLVATLGALTVFTVMRARSRSAGNDHAAAEWQVHRLAIATSPLMFVLLWPLYAIIWDASQGFYAALLTATAITMSVGYVIVTWSRRNHAPQVPPKASALRATTPSPPP